MGAQIKKIEYVFPKIVVTNEDLKNDFPNYDFEKFEEKVGIKKRYIVGEKETGLDLAEKACNKLFENIDKQKIDYILYCTQSPEYYLPTTACILQDRLGLRTDIGALDFNLGCSGFTYGVNLANALISSGQVENILLVTAETYSKFIHHKDKTNRSIFGDAAAATLISKTDDENIFKFKFGTDGSGYDKLIIKNGGSRFSINTNAQEIEYGTDNIYTDNHLYMNGPEIFNFTTKAIPNFVKEIMEENSIDIGQIDQFVFHQANSFMLDFLRKRIKIDSDNFYNDLSDGGNTVSCTIPIALKRYTDSFDKDKELTIGIVGFGVGLSWSGGIIKINNKL
ncbi:3-oxoacyl-ACP synthase III family protein [Sphingobacterium spiritivorum]|uniref:3-oxoacyl-ACP synthase III family protein n=1 Tax=Sphingobacterium spiritivorum TaxID=258 RepID=UPI003DA1F9D4